MALCYFDASAVVKSADNPSNHVAPKDSYDRRIKNGP